MHFMDKIPTTFEMDGLYTDRDIEDRFFVMKPCVDCLKYTKQDVRVSDKVCSYCGGNLTKNGRYWYSLRTFTGEKKFTQTQIKTMGR